MRNCLTRTSTLRTTGTTASQMKSVKKPARLLATRTTMRPETERQLSEEFWDRLPGWLRVLPMVTGAGDYIYQPAEDKWLLIEKNGVRAVYAPGEYLKVQVASSGIKELNEDR